MVASLLFVRNWWVLSHGMPWIPLIALWTIGIEEQFYLLWPPFVRWASDRAVFSAAFITIVVCQVVAFVLYSHHPTNDYQINFNSFTQFQYFGIGAVLALWSEHRTASMALGRRVSLLIVGCLGLMFAGAFTFQAGLLAIGPLTYNLISLVVPCACIAIFRAFLGAPSAWFPEWLRYLGRISFGLYVFNELANWIIKAHRGHISAALEVALCFAINLLFAMASYKFLEQPFLRIKQRFEVVKTQPVAVLDPV